MIAKADTLQSSINWRVDGSEKPSALAAMEVVMDIKGVWLSVHQPSNRLAEQHQKLGSLHILQNCTVMSSFCGIVQSDLYTAMVEINLYAAPTVSLFVIELH